MDETYQSLEFESFISDHELFKEENKLLPKDALTIHSEISFIQKTNSRNILNQRSLNSSDMPKYNHMEDFAKLFKNEDCSDVTIHINDEKFPAHKSILAARSSIFRETFKNSVNENRIVIDDVDEKIFEEVLRYVYTGNVENLETRAFELLLAADKYNIEGLKCMCENFICNTISTETVMKVLAFADLHKLQTLKAQAIEYIRGHITEVMESPHWNHFLSLPNLMNEVFEACLKR